MTSYLSRCRPQHISAFGPLRGEAMRHALPHAGSRVWPAQSHTMEQICQAPGSSPDSTVSTIQNDAAKMNVVELT
jgi:hypothetical protein